MTNEYAKWRVFRPGSRLHKYLKERKCKPFSKGILSCRQGMVELALHECINDQKLFDEGNRQIVLCDVKLEEALDRKSFHRSQISDIIESHFIPLDSRVYRPKSRHFEHERDKLAQYRQDQLIPSIPSEPMRRETLCWINPQFRAVLNLKAPYGFLNITNNLKAIETAGQIYQAVSLTTF